MGRLTAFQAWLIDQVDRDDPVGDLARDFNVDCTWILDEFISDSDFRDRVRHDAYQPLTMGAGTALEAWDVAYMEWRTV